MINPFNDIDWQPDQPALRAFGRSLVIGGAILFVVFSLLAMTTTMAWVNYPRTIFAIVALVGAPIWFLPGKWALPLYLAWYAFGASIGIILANIVLAAFYFTFFTGIAFILRLSKRDPLNLTPPTNNSNWHQAPPRPARRRYTRQY